MRSVLSAPVPRAGRLHGGLLSVKTAKVRKVNENVGIKLKFATLISFAVFDEFTELRHFPFKVVKFSLSAP